METPEQKPYEVATRETGSPAELMMKAVAGGMDIDKIKQMMDLQERWEANQARKAYTEAMAAFKKNPRRSRRTDTLSSRHQPAKRNTITPLSAT